MKKKESAAAIKGTPSFESFWRAYPLHRGKLEAERAWKRLTAEQKQLAIAALPAYTADCQQHGIAYKYAQGWLNGHRWEDNLSEEVAVKKADAAMPQPSATPPQPAHDKHGSRIGVGITNEERMTFDLLKAYLLRAWSRNRNERNGAYLSELLKRLELYAINDTQKVIYIRGNSVTFNREFTVPWFWEPSDVDAIVAKHFNNYKWKVFI